MRTQSVSEAVPRPNVTGRYGGLERVRTEPSAQLLGPLERSQTVPDEHVVPASAVLVEKQDGLSGGADAGTSSRRLDLHEGNEAVDLGLVRQELGQDPTEAKSLLAQRGAHPVLSGRGRVTLVEHEIEHLEDRRHTGGPVGPLRDLEGHPGVGEAPFGSHDPLGHRGLRDEEGTSDLVRGEAPQEAQGENRARLGGEDGVTRDEDEP